MSDDMTDDGLQWREVASATMWLHIDHIIHRAGLTPEEEIELGVLLNSLVRGAYTKACQDMLEQTKEL